MTLTMFLLSLGAALRLTRLGVEDSITQPFRDFLARRADIPPDAPTPRRREFIARPAMWLVQLFECPWCLGFWMACLTTFLAAASNGSDWYLYPAIALTISYLIGVAETVVVTIEEI